MAQRKKYSEDPRIKEWTRKSLKNNFEELRISMKKKDKARFRAYCDSIGVSMSSLVQDFIRETIEKSGFVYEDESGENADE